MVAATLITCCCFARSMAAGDTGVAIIAGSIIIGGVILLSCSSIIRDVFHGMCRLLPHATVPDHYRLLRLVTRHSPFAALLYTCLVQLRC